jgi:hypothetical protein
MDHTQSVAPIRIDSGRILLRSEERQESITMSQFYGSVVGSARTAATRRGTKSSGISAHVRGWDTGIYAEIEDINGIVEARVYVTGGSNNAGSKRLLAIVRDGVDVTNREAA